MGSTVKVGKLRSGSLVILKLTSHGGTSKAGAIKGLSYVARRSLLDLIFSSHLRPNPKVGGEATAIGMFFNVGGFGSSMAMVKGIGLSTLLGSALNGVKGGFSLSLAYLSSIIGSDPKLSKFLKTLSIEVSSLRGKGSTLPPNDSRRLLKK